MNQNMCLSKKELPCVAPGVGPCTSAQCPVAQFLSILCPYCREAQKPKPKIDYNKKPIVWVLGGPGSGKDTQCSKISAKYGFVHISTGELLRQEVKKVNTQRGKEIATIMAQGDLVPNKIVLELVKEAIEANAQKAKGFLIDGFPREKSQGAEFEKAIAPVAMIKYFDASHDILTKRLLHRAQTSGRSDDNEDTIKLRLKTFDDNNESVLAQYPDILKRINAEKPVDEVFAEVETHLDPLMAQIAALK